MSWRYLVILLLLTATVAASKWGDRRMRDQLVHPLSGIPDHFGEWRLSSEPRFSEEVEGKLAATEYLSRMYRSGNSQLGLLVSYYAEQKAGETMHSPQACLPGAGWEAWDYGYAYVPVGNQRFKVNRYGVQKAGQREQVLYWYQSKSRIIASEYEGKALLVWDSLTGGNTGGALVRLTLADSPDAVDQEVRVASQVISEVWRCLGPASRTMEQGDARQ
jgi:EpsI family protein